MHDKVFATFSPVAALGAEESDRHYREVHVPFAQRMLRAREQVVSYHPGRVTAELDLAGGWRQRPTGFRHIVLRFLPGRSLELDDVLHERLVQDHRRCLSDLRSFPVQEEVVVDRLRGQTSLVKHVVELDRPAGADAAAADDRLAQLVACLAAEAGGAFGFRQLLVDRVTGEGATEAVDEPGQRPLRRLLPSTERHAFVELYLDGDAWAQEYLARPGVREALQDPWWASTRVSRVDEECGMDRR